MDDTFVKVPLCGATFRAGGWSVRDISRGNADIALVHLSLYPAWGMSPKQCEQLSESHYIPYSVFQTMLAAIFPEHRPLFKQWRRKEARRQIRHWFLTWKYRKDDAAYVFWASGFPGGGNLRQVRTRSERAPKKSINSPRSLFRTEHGTDKPIFRLFFHPKWCSILRTFLRRGSKVCAFIRSFCAAAAGPGCGRSRELHTLNSS